MENLHSFLFFINIYISSIGTLDHASMNTFCCISSFILYKDYEVQQQDVSLSYFIPIFKHYLCFSTLLPIPLPQIYSVIFDIEVY